MPATSAQTRSLSGSDDTSTPNGPTVDVLTDPAARIGQLAGYLGELATRWTLAHTVGAAVLLTTVAGWRWWRSRCRARLSEGARVVTILPPPQVDPTGAAAFWARVTGLLRPGWQRWLSGQPHLVFEYAFDTNGMRLRLWVPGGTPAGLVARAVEAAWPGAQTRTTPATCSPLPATGQTSQNDGTSEGRPLVVGGGQLRLARAEALPIRAEFPTDPLRGLYGAPGPLGTGEQAIVQIFARPVTGRRATAARHGTTAGPAAGYLAHGVLIVVGRMLVTAVREVFDLLIPGPATGTRTTGSTPAVRPGQRAHQLRLAEQSRDRAIVAKQIGPRFETLIRYATTAIATDTDTPSSDRSHNESTTNTTSATEVARGRCHAIASAFEVVGAHNHYRRRRLRHPRTSINRRQFGHGDVLSVDEVATLAHLPTDGHVAGLARAGANAIAPPPGTPCTGPHIRPLGDSDAAGSRRPVGLAVADARQHLHVLGATGSGKSELLAQLVLADAHAGRGAVVVDPKGDLVTDVLSRLPERAGARVVLFDAGSKLPPPCLNPLQATDNHALVVDQVTSIFSRVYADSWGPRTDDLLRVGLLTLTAQPDTPTLAQLPRLLTDPGWRHGAVAHVRDPVVAGFWTSYEQMSDAARMAVIAPLMNKLRGFLLKPFVRAAIAAGPSTVTMSEVLDGGGLCLVRIPAGTLGAETAHLVGSLIVAETWQAATARTGTPQHQRADASLYLDEAHHFLNLPYPVEDMLAAARGYRLSMTLAHQNLAQLPGEVAEAISTNARTKIWFTASPEDARRLARHTGPHLSEHDLSHLGAFQAAVRPVVDNRETSAFTIATRKLPPPVPGRARQVRAAAHHGSGQPESAQRARRHPATTSAARATADPRRRHRP